MTQHTQSVQIDIVETIIVKDLDSGETSSLDPTSIPEVHQLTNIQKQSVWEEYWQERGDLKQLLFRIVAQGKVQKLKQVLKKQAVDLSEYQYMDGWNLLHHATYMNNSEIIEILIANGTDINAKTTSMKRTSLHLAVINNNPQIIQFLLKEKADPNCQDVDFCTPLHYAVQFGYIGAVERLLSFKNIDFSIKNHKKMTPIDCCKDRKAYKLFQSYGGEKMDLSPSKIHLRRFIETNGNLLLATKSRADYVEFFINHKSQQPKQQDQSQVEERRMKPKNKRVGKIAAYKFQFIKMLATKSVNNYHEWLQAQKPSVDSVNNYDFLRKIGQGSFGQVFVVRKKQASKLYAIKRMQKKSIIKNKLKKYIYTEKQIMKTIRHPFITAAYSFFQDDWYIYIVMDFCEGGDLENFHCREKINEQITKNYCCEVILALEVLHQQNYLFRDLKVGNVLIDAEGHVKLTDFGLAKQSQLSYSFLGSVSYLAPEMLVETDNKMHSSSIDWYLLGVLCYELLTGYPPFYSPNVVQMHEQIKNSTPKIPSWVSKQCKIFLKSILDKNPEKRLGSKGAKQIKNHDWFKQINWKDVLNRKLELPKPDVGLKQLRRKQVINFEEWPEGEKPQYFTKWDFKSGLQ